jgi:hypothetical protein
MDTFGQEDLFEPVNDNPESANFNLLISSAYVSHENM